MAKSRLEKRIASELREEATKSGSAVTPRLVAKFLYDHYSKEQAKRIFNEFLASKKSDNPSQPIDQKKDDRDPEVVKYLLNKWAKAQVQAVLQMPAYLNDVFKKQSEGKYSAPQVMGSGAIDKTIATLVNMGEKHFEKFKKIPPAVDQRYLELTIAAELFKNEFPQKVSHRNAFYNAKRNLGLEVKVEANAKVVSVANLSNKPKRTRQ